jgi:hypothetical protein
MTPKFYKTQCHYFKIYSEDKCICVTDLKSDYEISLKHSKLPINIGAVVSTKEEFELYFNKVQIEINNIYESNN